MRTFRSFENPFDKRHARGGVLYAVDITLQRKVAVCVVELGDFERRAGNYKPTQRGSQIYLRFGRAVHLAYARHDRFFPIGHIDGMGSEFGIIDNFFVFHANILCGASREY